MVVRIKTGKRIQGALSYNERKVAAGKAELILASRFGAELHSMGFSQKLNRFQRLIANNQYVKNNTLHLSLNFSPNDSLTKEKMQMMAYDYMKRIGFGDQPFLVYLHNDTNHPHLHIVTTNIQANGRAIDMYRLGIRKSEPVRKAMELEYDLIPAESMKRTLSTPLRPVDIAAALYSEEETKRQITNIVKSVTSFYHFTDLEEFNQILRCYNIQADPGLPGSRQQLHEGLVYTMIDKQGKQLGVAIKASSIDTKPTMKFLKKKFAVGMMTRRQDISDTKEKLLSLFQRLPTVQETRLLSMLDKLKMDVTVQRDSSGQITGLLLIDHRTRVAVTSAELGIEAEELQQRVIASRPQLQTIEHRSAQQVASSGVHPIPLTAIAMEISEILLASQQQAGGVSHGKRARKRPRPRPR